MQRGIRLSILVIFLLAWLTPTIASAEELSVAAAADLNFAMKEIAAQYHQDTGNTLKLSFGSSGNFFVQIQNGAPFDVFMSADMDYPTKLEQQGQAEPGTLYRYAIGTLVLWVPNASKLQPADGLGILLDASVKKIAIANPAHAPYGRVAEELLKKSGVYDRVKDKLVLGENVSQAAQFVETGNAQAALIPRSLASSPEMKSTGRSYGIGGTLNQAAVVLKSSRHKALAKQFLQYLQSPEITHIFNKWGFRVVGPGGSGD